LWCIRLWSPFSRFFTKDMFRFRIRFTFMIRPFGVGVPWPCLQCEIGSFSNWMYRNEKVSWFRNKLVDILCRIS
jgi:hypothetical protein